MGSVLQRLSELRTLFDEWSDGILVTDQNGAVAYRNKAAAETPSAGRVEELPVARVLGGAIVRSPGMVAFPLKREDGSCDGAVFILRSTVESRRVREALEERDHAARDLRKTEERFQMLLENSACGFALVDRDGAVRHSGPPILGHEAKESVGVSVFELIHPQDRKRVMGLFRRVRETPGATASAQFRAKHRDGSWRWVEGTCRNLIHEPAIGAIVINYRDVTDRIRLEEQFRQAQKMEALGTLAGGVAHDFNNLLTIITGYGQMVLDDPKCPEQFRSTVQEIVKAGHHAASLTGQLLAFSRRHASQAKVLDLNTVVSSMEKMLRRVIGEDIRLITAPGPVAGKVKVDPGQIEQVIMNLAVNARDAMPLGGQLRIETRQVELTEASPGDPPPGKYVLLSVSDTGCGMDERTKDRLFEPFFTTKEKGKGTGLGLSTVYGIVKQSGGYISVSSQPGAGTTFQIHLPWVDEAAQVAPRKSARREMRRTETVLLVEDDDAVRKLTRHMLERQGYTVLEAGDGPAALNIAERHQGPLDLLLTDVIMPLMSGLDLVHRIKALRPGLKVVYMSGYTDDVIAYHGMPQLPEDAAILKKPFSAEELIHRLRQILDAGAHSRQRHGGAPQAG